MNFIRGLIVWSFAVKWESAFPEMVSKLAARAWNNRARIFIL